MKKIGWLAILIGAVFFIFPTASALAWDWWGDVDYYHGEPGTHTYYYSPYADYYGSYEQGYGPHTYGYSYGDYGPHHGYHYNPEHGWHSGSHWSSY